MATDRSVVAGPVATPFVCEGFEGGALPTAWTAETTTDGVASGRVQVTTAFPHTGSYALDLDTDCDGCGASTRQAAILAVDLTGQSNVELRFWVHEHGDENNPEDGVFVSDDGGSNYALIVSLNNFPASYAEVVIDLDAAIAGAGLSYTSKFQIKFQSFDNFSIPTDGYSFDDICLIRNYPYDVDGDGDYSPLTDGLMLLRYGFGFRGDVLVTGAVGADCARCDAAAIETFIESYLP